MKRAVIVFAVAALVMLTTGLWIFGKGTVITRPELIQLGVILLIVLFALYFGYRRVTSAKRGEPSEDEMSKKVLLKTAALSYYISLYMWVGVIFINSRIKMDTEVLIGSGILGMAVVFALSWIWFNFRGVKNE